MLTSIRKVFSLKVAENFKALKKMRLLQSLTNEDLLLVAEVLQNRHFPKGKAVISAGGHGGSVYLVKRGVLKVSHVIRGRRRVLGTFQPGDHFGEVSFIDKKPRSATIYAVTNSELLILTRKALETLQHRSPKLQIKLLQALLEDLAGKLRERKFSLDFELSDLLPVYIFEMDLSGVITFANRNGLDFFGYSQTDFDQGLNIYDFFLLEDVKNAKKAIQKTLTGGDRGVFKYTVQTKSNDKVPVLFHLDPLLRDGKISGFRATLVDITEQRKAEDALKESEKALRKAHDELEIRVQERTAELHEANVMLQRQIEERMHAERALRISEERYRAVMEQSADGIFLVDPASRRILEGNQASQNLLGYTTEEIRKKSLYDVMNQSQNSIDLEIREVQEGRLQAGGLRDFKRKNGSLVKVEIRLGLVSFGGKIVLCSIVRDVTDRLRNEVEKKELEDNLRKAHMMETMGRLVSGVAHEVRNPLNAIQATTEALQQDLSTNPDYQPFLEIIGSQVRRLSELMRELLELGRPADRSRMQEESIKDLCAGAIQVWKQTTAYSKHFVELAAPDDSSLHAVVDSARMQQVLLNLLDNAAQHSPEPNKIQIGISEGENAIFIRVSDAGCGVTPENLSRLFQPFFTTRRGGIGLGLSLVKHIVEIHGGHVSLYNNHPNPGVTVEIMLKPSDQMEPSTK